MPNSFTIANGVNIPLNVQTGTIPNMGTALLDWFQLLTFGIITKTVVAFQVDETVTDISFWGLVQPLTGRQLSMKSEGQRKWNWISVYAQAAPSGALLSLLPDDLIIFQGTQYRVAVRKDYALYSYTYYELVQDYTGGVPTP